MRPRTCLRAACLAVSLMLGGAGAVLAHALPGSVLTFSHKDEDLRLVISFPLEDLMVASSEFETWEDALVNENLTPAQMAQITGYFAQHVAITHAGEALPLVLTDAVLRYDQNADVGLYVRLVATMAAPLAQDEPVFPLVLTYDALMHEIRSHRADVYWQDSAGMDKHLTNFGFRRVDDQPRSVELLAP